MKKIMALFLAMAMVLGMSVTTFAADTVTGTSEDKGSITITNVAKGLENDGIAVYKIVEAEYNNSGSFSGYKVADLYKSIMVNEDGESDYVTLTPTILDQLGNKALEAGTPIEVTEGWTYSDADKKYSTTHEFDAGRYLIVLTGADATIYNYAVASIYYVNKDGNNDIIDGDLDIENTTGITLKDGEAYVKASSHPEVTKKAETTVNGQKVPADTANIGDVIEYTVEINPVPYYGGENPVLNAVDTLSEGLSLEDIAEDGNLSVVVREADDTNNTGTVVATLTKDTDFIATATKDASNKKDILTVDFVTGTPGAYQLNDYAGKKIVITYKAVLNNDAKLNEDGNNNDVVLNFTKDSKVTGDETKGTDEDKTYTYTFDLSGTLTGDSTTSILTKTGESTDTTTEKLAGAVFELYTKNANGEKVAYENTVVVPGTIKVDGQDKNVKLFDGPKGTITSDNNGKLIVKGLAAGTYYLKEIEAPKGYSLNTHEFVIVVSADVNDEGTLLSWSISVDDKELFAVENGVKKAEPVEKNGYIPNTKITTLPSTGGIGTTIFTIGGCAIMILAAALYFATRRKTVK